MLQWPHQIDLPTAEHAQLKIGLSGIGGLKLIAFVPPSTAYYIVAGDDTHYKGFDVQLRLGRTA